jgi:hypothetical protein
MYAHGTLMGAALICWDQRVCIVGVGDARLRVKSFAGCAARTPNLLIEGFKLVPFYFPWSPGHTTNSFGTGPQNARRLNISFVLKLLLVVERGRCHLCTRFVVTRRASCTSNGYAQGHIIFSSFYKNISSLEHEVSRSILQVLYGYVNV